MCFRETTSRRCLTQSGFVAFVAFVVNAVCIGDASHSMQAQEVERRPLVAAANMKHPPFSSWNVDKQAEGIEVDIVNEAARRMGRSVKWIERPFAELIPAIEAGEVDVAVSTIGITEQRRNKVAFSDHYYRTNIVALVMPDSKTEKLSELSGAKIGADPATTSFTVARKTWPKASFVSKKDGATWPQMLNDGSIDAFVVDASDQNRLESESGIKLRKLEEPLAEENFGIAVGKDADDLLAAVNLSVTHFQPTVALRIGGEYQFTTPRGRRITSLVNPPQLLVDNYLEALERFERSPESVEASIWFGRRAGYLLRTNQCLQIFTEAIKKHPDEARLYRHRGHRYISTRQYDKAIADLEHAVTLIEGTEDIKEPDGAPNPQGIELTTLQGNIWYHLGLAYYLKNDMPNALRCFQQRTASFGFDDNLVSCGHWSYMIARRMGQDELAKSIVAPVRTDMEIIENMRYHEMCLFYGGKRSLETVTADAFKPETSGDDVLLYGLGNWYLYERNDKAKSRELFETLFEQGSPLSFAYIAAEADFERLFADSPGK